MSVDAKQDLEALPKEEELPFQLCLVRYPMRRCLYIYFSTLSLLNCR